MSKDEQKLFILIDRIVNLKNDFVRDYLSDLKTLKEESFYFLTGGKSIRAALCGLAAAEIELPIFRVIPFCASLELIHLYSIIHDDLPAIDNALERRDKKSLHLVFGESAAILVGDMLQAKAYHLLYKYYSKNNKLIDAFFAATTDRGIIKGQLLDITNKLKTPSLSELITIYKLKTGALFSLAVSAAPLIKNSPKEKVDLFKEIGETFGIAYQIKDDIEDKNETLEPNITKSIDIKDAYKVLSKYTEKLYKLTEKFYFLNKFSNMIFKEVKNAQNN